MENIMGSLVIIGLGVTLVIFIVYSILNFRIKSNLNKLEQKIQDMKYDRDERNLDISHRLRTLEHTFRDTERLLRNATLVKTVAQSASSKSSQTKSTSSKPPQAKSVSNKPSRETRRNTDTPSSSRNSAADDNYSTSNLFHTTMAASSYTSPSSSDSCSSSSSSSSYDSGSSSSSSCDSSSSF